MRLRNLSLISLFILCLSASHVFAGIRPSFNLETCAWNATDIVVATEGKKIDGVFQVLETWKGSLNPGDLIKIPELASFAAESARVVSNAWHEKKKGPKLIVTGDRLILFLKHSVLESMQTGSLDITQSTAAIKWKPTGYFGEFSVSVVWVEQGKPFGFVQLINPGPSLLIKLGESEEELKNQALQITDVRKSFLQALSIADPVARAAAIQPFTQHAIYQVRQDAFESLKSCGPAALKVSRSMLADESLLASHQQVVEVISEAGRGEAGPDLAKLLEQDLQYWRSTGPTLEKGWWNGKGFDSLEEVEPLRNRYGRDYSALEALAKRPYPKSETLIREFRELWSSSTQLSDIGSEQMTKSCDEVLKQLERLKANTSAVKIEGLWHLDKTDLIKAIGNKVEISRADFSGTPDVIEKAKTATAEYLTSQGYWHAKLVAEYDPNSRVLTLVIDEGERSKVTALAFTGNRVFSAGQLQGEMSRCLADLDADGYSVDSVEFCLRKLVNFVRSKGYLQAEISDPEVSEHKDGLAISFKVAEGRLFTLGKLTIDGAAALSPNRIREILNLKEGESANGDLIGRAVYEDLKKYYGSLGYVEYTAEITPSFKNQPQNGSEGVVDLAISIDEGKQFRINSIRFTGTQLPQKRLLDLLLIQPGDIYNQDAYERSIEKLNDSGLCEEIDKDRDVDFKTNQEDGTIELIIKILNEPAAERSPENLPAFGYSPDAATLKTRPPDPPR